MKTKFAITCIILLIVANLSVVYFRSCKEGFIDDDEDPPKKKNPCIKLVSDVQKMYKKMISAESHDDINELTTKYKSAYKAASNAKCDIPDITKKSVLDY
jgi:hypothetical protein